VGAKPYNKDQIFIVYKSSPCTEDNSIWKWQMTLDRYGGLDAPITFEIWNPSQGAIKSRPVAYYKTTIRALTFWERSPFMYLREISTKIEKKKVK